MATDNELLIKVKADTDRATKELVKLSKQVTVLTKEVDKSKKSLKSQETALDGISKSSKNVSDTFKKLTLGLGAMGIALKGVEFAKLAADAEQGADAFDKVVTDMGKNSIDTFNEIKKASKGLISDADIKQSATAALSLGVPLEKLAELMEVARAKSREMGTDAKKAFEDLATGIGRGSPMILDNLGLTIKLGDANQKYADEIGKTVEQLTKQDKQIALTNAVIEAGKSAIDRYADSSLSSKEKTQKFEASLDNLKVKIGNELLPEMTKLTESATEWMESLDKDSISSFGDGVSALFATIEKLVGVVADLNDIAMPDWIGGDDSGLIGTALEGWGKLIELFSKASDVLKNLSLSDELSTKAKQTTADVDSLTNAISLLEIGAKQSVDGFSLQGDGLSKLREEYAKNSKSLQDALSENLRLQEFFMNDKSKERGAEQLAKLREEQLKIEESSKKLGATYSTIFGDDIPKSVVKSTETVVKLSAEQQKALDKLNNERVEDAEKTIKILLKNEDKLTKDILKLNDNLAKDLKNIENDRLDSKIHIENKIRELERGGLSEKEAYYQKEKDADKLLSDAKRALISGDLDAYKAYADAYRSLVEQNADSAIIKNGAILVSEKEVRSNSIKNLKELGELENQYYDKKASSAQVAHDQEIAYKQIEIDLVKLNIEAQRELIKLSSQPKGVPLDSAELDAVLAKIEGLKTGLNSIQSIPAKVNTDTTSIDIAKNKIEDIKTITINGITLEVNADTTAADFRIDKLVTNVDGKDINMEVNPEYEKAEELLVNFRDTASSEEISTVVTADTTKAEKNIGELKKTTSSNHKVNPNTAAAQAAINKLKQPTSSVHTVYERVVPARAGGGLIPQRLAVGGTFTGSGKVPGYDMTDSDKVNAVLTGGEYVINRRAVDKIGVETLHAINSFRFPKVKGYSKGGSVDPVSSSNISPDFRPINLNIGNKTFEVMSEESVAKALENYLKIEGGI